MKLIPHTKNIYFIYDSQNINHNPYIKAYVNKKRAEIEKRPSLYYNKNGPSWKSGRDGKKWAEFVSRPSSPDTVLRYFDAEICGRIF